MGKPQHGDEACQAEMRFAPSSIVPRVSQQRISKAHERSIEVLVGKVLVTAQLWVGITTRLGCPPSVQPSDDLDCVPLGPHRKGIGVGWIELDGPLEGAERRFSLVLQRHTVADRHPRLRCLRAQSKTAAPQ